MPLDFFRSRGIVIRLPAVLAAIDLDDQLSVDAYEIDDVAKQGNLSTELYAVELTVAQERPKDFLRFGGAPPELSSELPSFSGHHGMMLNAAAFAINGGPSPLPLSHPGEGFPARSGRRREN